MTHPASELQGKAASIRTKNDDEAFEKLLKSAQKKTQKPEELHLKEIEDRVVEELNKKHAVIHTDQFYILTEKPHAFFDGIDFTLESRQSFINTYENQTVTLPDGKTKSKTKIWLSHEKRRQFHGIIFNPETLEHKNGRYNIWKGFAVQPKQGDCILFKKHVRDVICGGNVEYYNYVWGWMSHLIQKPQELSPGIVLMGEQGIGKNTFSDTLGFIFGQHYLPLDNIEQFLGHFNFHLKNAVLIHGNEAIWGGDKRQLGKLKAMVTERFCVIEGKGKDQLTMRNFKHLILSSNEDWPVHLDRDDRRFLTLKVSNKCKEKTEYFNPLYSELNNGGREALLYELQQTDLSQFNIWKLPQNIESFEIKMESAPSTEKYIYEVLKAGSFDIGLLDTSSSWENAVDRYSILSESVFNDYKLWCLHQGIKHETDGSLGKAIKKLIISSEKSRHRDSNRKNQYNFPSIKRARIEFQSAYKVGEGIWL